VPLNDLTASARSALAGTSVVAEERDVIPSVPAISGIGDLLAVWVRDAGVCVLGVKTLLKADVDVGSGERNGDASQTDELSESSRFKTEADSSPVTRLVWREEGTRRRDCCSSSSGKRVKSCLIIESGRQQGSFRRARLLLGSDNASLSGQ
jgi:hypothetical protein